MTALDGAADAVFYLAMHPLREIGGNYKAEGASTFESRYAQAAGTAADLYTNAATAELSYLRKNVRLLSEH